MNVHTLLTIKLDSEHALPDRYEGDLASAAFQLGWTQSAFASVLNQIAHKYGEDALLNILDNVCITPVYLTSDYNK